MPDRAEKIRVRCTLNGTAATLEAYPMARLLDVLARRSGLDRRERGLRRG